MKSLFKCSTEKDSPQPKRAQWTAPSYCSLIPTLSTSPNGSSRTNYECRGDACFKASSPVQVPNPHLGKTA